MKTSRSLGVGHHGAHAADIKLIQTALQSIQSPYGEYYYLGAIDGLCNEKTIAAIKSFQLDHHLPATGTISTNGDTFRKIISRTPEPLRVSIGASGGGGDGFTGTIDKNAVINQNNALANQVEVSWPLPSAEASDLANMIRKIGTELVIPPMYKHTMKVNLDAEGRFIVPLHVAQWAYKTESFDFEAKEDMEYQVKNFFSNSRLWNVVTGDKITIKTAATWPWLGAPLNLPSQEFLDFLGFGSMPKDPIVCHALKGVESSEYNLGLGVLKGRLSTASSIFEGCDQLVARSIIQLEVGKPLENWERRAWHRYDRNLDDLIKTYNEMNGIEQEAANFKGLFQAFDAFNEELLAECYKEKKVVENLSTYRKVAVISKVIAAEIESDIIILFSARKISSGFVKGKEYSFDPKKYRIAPLGNRTNHPTGRWPHYHRRRLDRKGGVKPNQGMKRHRPWDKKDGDKSFFDRF